MKQLSIIAVLFISSIFISATSFAQETKAASSLSPFLSLYYDIKNALISSDAKTAATKAADFVTAIKELDVKTLSEAEHNAFIPLKENLILDATHISQTKDIEHQRDHFSAFSTNFYTLAKTAKLSDKPIYQQYCPMKKMYWLSSQAAIKNPYYGKAMLTCGKVTDTIK